MTTSIKIHERDFPVLRDAEGTEHVKLQDLCEPFGLEMSGQRERLKKTGWATLSKIYSVRSSGKRTAFLCLPLREVPMLFATLQPGHVNDAFRPALVEMQREVTGAVFDYFDKGGAIRPSALPQQLQELSDKIDEILRAVPLTDAIWPDRFVKRYEAWNGRVWARGDHQPFSMKNANWFFYGMIFPAEVLGVIKARGLAEAARYHQVLADAPRDYVQRQLDFATKLADDCGSEAEWRKRMRRAYGKTKADLMGQGGLSL